MRSDRLALFGAVQLATAFSMFPTLTPPEPRLRRSYSPTPYHLEGRDTVLMDWDLPKGKRAKRRARGRREVRQERKAAG